MELGVFVRNMGPQSDRQILSRCARQAETAGFDGVFVVDHLALPPDQAEGSGGRYLDPMTTLGYLAGITERITLGVGVLVLPYRPPVLTAKQVATLQALSGERLILGAGVGWLRAEFEILGVDPRQRGAITDETLDIIRTLFGNDVTGYQGKHFSFQEFVFAPRPECPPIWIGGSGPRAMDRTLEFGDAFFPLGNISPESVEEARGYLRDGANERNRSVPAIVTGGDLDPDTPAAVDRLCALRDAGVDYYVTSFGRYADADAFEASTEHFMANIAPAIRA